MGIKKIVKRLLGDKGDKWMGYADYFRYPNMKNPWGGPFNGQKFRTKIFHELMAKIPFSAIIETGTYKGTTTGFMAHTSGLPVYSVESDLRNYGFVRMRFFGNRKIKIFLGDSRWFLKKCASLPGLSGTPVFFYLDAHWEEDLPLRDEIDIIFKNWKQAIVMIDDFRVPGDEGYQYDDYGNGRVLCMGYLNKLDVDLSFFFPSLDSSQETGKKRGCTVMVQDQDLERKVERFNTLTRY